jgi:hypothetical protein
MSYLMLNPIGGTLIKSNKTTAYSAGKIIAQSATAGSCAPIILPGASRRPGDGGMIRRVRLKVDDASWLNAVIRVHFHKLSPTFVNGDDGNIAAGLSESDYLGSFQVTLNRQFSDFVKGIAVPVDGIEIAYTTDATGAQNALYAVLEAAAASAGGHTASKTFTLVAEVFPS